MQVGYVLTGERVCIRDSRRADGAFCAEMWLDAENGRYMSDPEEAYADEEYRQALRELEDSPDGYYLMIEAGGEPVGSCCAFPDDERKVYDIGYCIHKNHWRKGYGQEAVRMLVEWLRQQGAERITAEVAMENAASNALLRTLGCAVTKETEFKKYGMDVRYKSYIYELIL